MVKSADKRIAKYKAKINGDVAKNRYDATKDISTASENDYAPCAEILENAIKVAIDGVAAILLPYYIIFGKEVQKALENHETNTANAEIATLRQKWGPTPQGRGLVDATLGLVEAAVRGLAPCP